MFHAILVDGVTERFDGDARSAQEYIETLSEQGRSAFISFHAETADEYAAKLKAEQGRMRTR